MSGAMREEPTERDRRLARAVVNSDWFADQLARARREALRHVRERIDHEAVNVEDALRIIDAECDTPTTDDGGAA